MGLGILIVLCFIVMLTEAGNRLMNQWIMKYPLISRSVNNMLNTSQKIAKLGSVYSINKTQAHRGSVKSGATRASDSRSQGSLSIANSKSVHNVTKSAASLINANIMLVQRTVTVGNTDDSCAEHISSIRTKPKSTSASVGSIQTPRKSNPNTPRTRVSILESAATESLEFIDEH